MWTDMYLKFADEAEANAVLYTKQRPAGYEYADQEVDVFVYQTDRGEYTTQVEVAPEDLGLLGYTYLRTEKRMVQVDPSPDGGEWDMKPNYMNIDTIGVIYEPQPIPDPENPPTPIPYDGWFVNVRVLATEDAAPLEPFSIDPQPYPMRVWG